MSASAERTYLEAGLEPQVSTGSSLMVTPKELCTRCGACHVICPKDVVRFNEAELPYIQTGGCIDCGLCLKVCPGIGFDLKKYHQKLFNAPYDISRVEGYFQNAYLGYSKNPRIRAEGSSGGVVTQLLIDLLRQDFIDCALVVGSHPDDPLTLVPLLARTEEEIRAAAQSKYVVVANTRAFRELRNTQERIAFVGIPCQIQGLHLLEELNKQLAARVVVRIGLACRGAFEREVIPEFLAVRHIDWREVAKIGFRDGEFPGKIRVHYKDGRIQALHRHEIKDGAYNNLFRLYLPERCISCPDYSAEFSDLTCSDNWSRNRSGEYMYSQGVTLVLSRTERGQRIINAVMKSGEVSLEPIPPANVRKAYQRIHWEKKVLPFTRMEERRRQGKLIPNYGLSNSLTKRDRLMGVLYGKTFIFGRNAQVRRLALRCVFSPPGEGLLYLKIKAKKLGHTMKARLRH